MKLVLVEHDGQKLRKASLELFSAARGLGGPVTAVVWGNGAENVVEECAQYAEQVLIAQHGSLLPYTASVAATALAQLAKSGDASAVLVAGTRAGRELAPRVAVLLNAAYLEDCVAVEALPGGVRATHYAYLARVTETLEADGVCVLSLKPNALPAAAPLPQPGEIYEAELDLPVPTLEVLGRTQEKSERVALTEASVVVTGGRGMGSPEQFGMLETLADLLGAGVGATRAVVDAGWRPYGEQVGQTGKTVQPNAYLAFGVSGAVQHLSGMGKSKFIVAINKDAEAPIFKVADYGIVGDALQVLPALIEAAKTLKD